MIYESHVTVGAMDHDDFLETCREIGVKPVIIDMDTGSGLHQCMTAKFHKTDYRTAFQEMNDIAGQFDTVFRRKLEVVVGTRQEIPKHLYLEFHSKYIVPENELQDFVAAVDELGGHTSRNSLKARHDENMLYHFATSRSEVIQRKIIDSLPWKLVNTIRECVLFDSNPEIDTRWNCDCGIKQYHPK